MFGEDFLNEKNATITINKITKPAVHRQISDVIKKMGSKAPKVTKTKWLCYYKMLLIQAS